MLLRCEMRNKDYYYDYNIQKIERIYFNNVCLFKQRKNVSVIINIL